MNKHSKKITIGVLSLVSLFLVVGFVFWTAIPYLRMRNAYVALTNVLVSDKHEFFDIYSKPMPLDFTQPELRYEVLNYTFEKYQKDYQFLGGDKFFLNVTDRLAESLNFEGNYAGQYVALGKAYDLFADTHPEVADVYHRKAEELYKKALVIFPNYQNIYYAYSVNLANQGRVDEALAMINRALEGDDRVPASRYYLGAILYRQNPKNSDQALENLEYAINNKGLIDQDLTVILYEKMLKYYYENNDKDHFVIVVRRLATIDHKQSQIYNKILEYIQATNKLPIINLK